MEVINSYFQRPEWLHKNMDVEYFSQEYQLLEKWKNNPYDLLIMDIELNAVNGLDVVKYGRDCGRHPFVIFLSSYSEYALEAFDTEAYHYLVKPVYFTKFKQVLDRVFQVYSKDHQAYTIDFDHKKVVLKMGEIQYFESYKRVTNVFTARENYRTASTLDHEENLLPDHFFRIHQGYLVNLQHIRSIKGDNVVMDNGERLPISFRKKRKTLERFCDFVREHML